MSYPPTASGRPISPDAGRSSADMYSSVPGYEERLHDNYGGASSPPPHFADDNHYPERMQPSRSMGSFGLDNDPYARYGDNDHSGQGSMANLSEMDGQSQLGLHPRGGSGLAYGGNFADKDELDEAPIGAHRHLRRGGAAPGGGGFWSRLSSRAKRFLIIGLIVALLIIAIAVAVPAAIVSKNNSNKSEADVTGSSKSSVVASAPSGVPTGGSNIDWRTAATGGDGSTVYTEDGSSFVYNNTFGGFWNAVPFNDSAKAQADMPALNEKWDYSKNLISGVNLGGWLVTEPFIVPGLYEPFNPDPLATNPTVVDEWTLSEALGSNLTAVMTNHYETFITEKDFAEIAAAGLNWIRLPIPWWIVEVWDGEPFLANVGWTYFLKALKWARKYGLRVNLDLHSIPGSQNGYNHSGKLGSINFLNGVMGVANAQRTLDIIRTLTEFISQDQYKNVVPMFSILNEPYAATIGVDTLRHFYVEVYNMIREIGGTGEGNGPFIAFHDGFTGSPARQYNDVTTSPPLPGWLGWMPGMDRVALDTHPYLCFSKPNNDSISYQAAKPCSYWATGMNTTAQDFGYYMAGEWSLAFNDCGKWLNNVGNGQRYEGTYYIPGNTTAPEYAAVGSCEEWTNYPAYSQATKDGLKLVASGHMDAFRSWFFWTWKTGYSSQLGMIANPVWNYQLGLQEGWIPENPRTIVGMCTQLVQGQGVTFSNNPAPTLSAWMTGGAGAGSLLDQGQVSTYSAWPPASLGTTPVEFLPTYTPTASVVTLPSEPTPTSFPSGYSTGSVNVGDGWANSADSSGWMTTVAGCSYPNPWSGVEASIPTAACTGSAGDGQRMVKRNPSPTAASPSAWATITPAPAARR